MRRLFLLLACLAVGSAVGFIGWAFSGSQWWYLAIPAAIAVAWLKLANPERCLPQQARSNGGSSAA